MTYRLWRFRIAVRGRFGYHPQVWKVWDAQARVEGGRASFNPWNSTEPWHGATPYNDIKLPSGEIIHVWNYPSAAAGTAATVATLKNGNFPRMCHIYKYPGKLTARQIVEYARADFDRWGSGADSVLALL